MAPQLSLLSFPPAGEFSNQENKESNKLMKTNSLPLVRLSSFLHPNVHNRYLAVPSGMEKIRKWDECSELDEEHSFMLDRE